MGILDEAIREHLALKRRQGRVSDDELKRLEDEAFGPPTRPGEPDFPTEEGEDVGPEASDEREGTSERDGEAALEAPGQPSLEGAEVGPSGVGDERQAVTEPTPSGDEEAGASPGPTTEEAEASAPSEPLTEEAEAPPGDESQEPEEREVDESPAFYDRGGEGEFDVGELELELDDELAEDDESDEWAGRAEEDAEASVVSGPPIEEAERTIESLDTVEHPIEEDLEEAESDEFQFDEPESEELEPAAPDSEELEPEGPGSDQEGTGEHEPGETPAEGEDVLEETPEFLRDAPEDDELWFEQGEPKDFDF